MRQSRAQREERRLEGERALKFKGTARISLDVLYFRRDQSRELNPKQVGRLKECFQKEGCHRLQVCRHIPAIIDQQCLDSAMRKSGVSAGRLLSEASEIPDYPRLLFPSDAQLECLHGRHRVQAAKEVLSTSDKWWTVDLYLSDLNANLKTCLVEEYSNEEKPSDGELYCKIRQYHFQRNYSFEMRWRARLRGSRPQKLKSLLRNTELTEAFDNLLCIPGLWGGMMITTLHKVLAMGCLEVGR